jgi:hypothetical protein
VEEVLPVESVQEYFEHFSVLEIDFTFYSLLLGKDGTPTQNYKVLRRYREFMKEGDRLVLKMPQVISAQKIRRGGGYLENETCLDPKMFTNAFYALAKADHRAFNSRGPRIVRLMTPIDMRYEVAYAKAHPFDNSCRAST